MKTKITTAGLKKLFGLPADVIVVQYTDENSSVLRVMAPELGKANVVNYTDSKLEFTNVRGTNGSIIELRRAAEQHFDITYMEITNPSMTKPVMTIDAVDEDGTIQICLRIPESMTLVEANHESVTAMLDESLNSVRSGSMVLDMLVSGMRRQYADLLANKCILSIKFIATKRADKKVSGELERQVTILKKRFELDQLEEAHNFIEPMEDDESDKSADNQLNGACENAESSADKTRHSTHEANSTF